MVERWRAEYRLGVCQAFAVTHKVTEAALAMVCLDRTPEWMDERLSAHGIPNGAVHYIEVDVDAVARPGSGRDYGIVFNPTRSGT